MKYISVLILSLFCICGAEAQAYVESSDMKKMQERVENYTQALASFENGDDEIKAKKQILKGLRYISSGFRNFNVVESNLSATYEMPEKDALNRDAAIENGAIPINFSPEEKIKFNENVADMKAVKAYFKSYGWVIDPSNTVHLEKLHLFKLAAESCVDLQTKFSPSN